MSTSQRLIGREEGNALAKLREILGRKGEGAAASVANTCGREECADHYFLPLSKCENGHDLPTLETVDATHLEISLDGGSMTNCGVLGKTHRTSPGLASAFPRNVSVAITSTNI